jgi:hypothetical protein
MRPLPGLWGGRRGDGQVGVREHGQGGVPVPGVVAADLVVVQAGLGLGGLAGSARSEPETQTPDLNRAGPDPTLDLTSSAIAAVGRPDALAPAAQPCTGALVDPTANTPWKSRARSPRCCYSYCMISPNRGDSTDLGVQVPPRAHFRKVLLSCRHDKVSTFSFGQPR